MYNMSIFKHEDKDKFLFLTGDKKMRGVKVLRVNTCSLKEVSSSKLSKSFERIGITRYEDVFRTYSESPYYKHLITTKFSSHDTVTYEVIIKAFKDDYFREKVMPWFNGG